MKIISAHQPAYLPWLGFFHKIAVSDVFLILDNVQFEKNSFINRNKIKGKNGSFWLTVPVVLKGHTQKCVKDTAIDNNQRWMKKHLRSIEENYCQSPYFDKYFSFFRECYLCQWENLTDLTLYMLRWFLKELNIMTDIQIMSEFSLCSKKSDLIIDICKEFGGDIYLSGELGINYLDVEALQRNNIKVLFQKYKHPQYKQGYGEFMANLSIIDMLFNYGVDTYDILMKGNMTRQDIQNLV